MSSTRAARKSRLHPPVFFGSLGLIGAFLVAAVIASQALGDGFAALQRAIAAHLGWFYIVAMGFFLLFAAAVACGPWGRIRLGPDGARPEFNTWTWLAMLFSAGMGIGLLFWSVAEPVMHFADPPPGSGGAGAAADEAMRTVFFHWGLHPWAAYAVVGLGLAYYAYRRGLPLAVRSLLFPLLGKRIFGWAGDLVDIVAVVGTMFGVATSLGLGAMQIAAGLGHLLDSPQTSAVHLSIIAGVTALATASVVSGIHRGVRRLSELNLILVGLLLIFMLLAGPTGSLLRALGANVAGYLTHLPAATLRTGWGSTDLRAWLGSWTVFYWAWWIAWAPFVGLFIARISKGRTVRELLIGALLAPTALTFLWLTVFGGSALFAEMRSGGIAAAVDDNVATALFVLLDRYPLSAVTGWAAVLSITLFFVTSSDSASLVIDIITAGGSLSPSTWQRVLWALTEGAAAAVLLVFGGLHALQTASLATALPICAIMLLMCPGLALALRRDLRG